MNSPGLTVRFVENEWTYDGRQIQSLWAYDACNVGGDSLIAFSGPCDIPPEYMVDHEDLKAGAEIYSPRMLHFIVEHFDSDLNKAVLRQRLLAVLAKECIERAAPGLPVERKGDDLFVRGRKLSISIATATRVSTKIHLGLNILTDGVPVPAIGLEELGVEPKALALQIGERYAAELQSINRARSKVRGVD